ncbi:MAG: ATP-binding protein [Saccharospirillum sp.]|uniref:two-component system sensor histidine kinase NtrB n=1 Tax=Saccharospirillum sp. TaxID=2033801 RepID=UPI00329808DF
MAYASPTLLGRILWWLLGITVVSSLSIGFVFFSGQHLHPLVVMCLIVVISILGSAVLLQIFRRHFLNPLNQLMLVSNQVTATSNVTLRAKKHHQDELGKVVDAFNAMLDQMARREADLKAERDRATLAGQESEAMAEAAQKAMHKLEFEVQVRHRVERRLTEFQNYLNAIINSMPSALIAVDEKLIVTQWNTEAALISGTRPEQAIGLSLQEAFPFLGQHQDLILLALTRHKVQSRHNLELQTAEQPIRVDLVVYPLQQTDSQGAVIRLDDVTEQFKLEEVMVQTEKMMSVGGLAAGMAHEINNPLGAIVQNAQNIERRLDPALKRNRELASSLGLNLELMQQYLATRDVPKFLTNISESGLRASRIVTNMLQFSRDSDRLLQPYPIGQLLDQAINIALNDFNLKSGYRKQHLFVDQDFRSPEVEVPCVMTELEQVLLNLMKNAAQAIRERFDTLNDIDEGIIQIRQYVQDDHCVIEVADNGIGMDEPTRKRIFEPFFTTKDVGVGTGLGLSVSFFIITTHHHGRLQVESTVGQGARFILSLPLTDPLVKQTLEQVITADDVPGPAADTDADQPPL